MASPRHTAERLTAVEARIADIESGYGQTIYRLERRTVRTELGVARILQHLGLAPVDDEHVDQVLDES